MTPPNSLSHQEKVAHLIAEFEQRGIDPQLAAPPIYRFLWTFGVKIPPPPFHSFPGTFLSLSILFVTACGGLALVGYIFFHELFISWWDTAYPRNPVFWFLALPLVTSLFFATVHWFKKQMLGLPRWRDYPDLPLEDDGP